jgi:hypothetical protein
VRPERGVTCDVPIGPFSAPGARVAQRSTALARHAGLRASARARATKVDGATERTVVERAQGADAPECCGERYVLREEQRGSLVRRWFTRERKHPRRRECR